MSIVTVLLVTGCLSSPDGDDGPAKDITLIIDFEGFDPDTYPDERVEWNVDTVGDYDRKTEERAEGAYYVINDLAATDALHILEVAEDATGIPTIFHMEAQGAFVDSIDGIVNGQDGHYWSYYINDEYGLVSADTADLEDGDEVRWVYMGNPFG
jgi:hypothetical protein